MLEYDAERMHSLPIGVFIVGMKMHGDKVPDAMESIDNLLRRSQLKTLFIDTFAKNSRHVQLRIPLLCEDSEVTSTN